MIRVMLVDDQTLVRQGVRSLLALAEGIEVIAEAGDGRQARRPSTGRDGHGWFLERVDQARLTRRH